MKKTKPVEYVTYSLVKVSEGGRSKKDLMQDLKDAGIKCRNGYTPYVGHYGIEVDCTKSRKVEKILGWR